MFSFKEFLTERISSIEAESNKRHMDNAGAVHAGPDPVVQREIKNQGVLYRVAKAQQKPLVKLRQKFKK